MVWFKTPMDIVDPANLNHLLPTEDMSIEEQHNSFMRFVLVFSALIFLINKNPKVVFIPLFGGILSVILFNTKELSGVETFEKMDERAYKCTKPSANNPFMNVLVSDYKDQPTKEKACDVTSEKVKDQMATLFTNDLFRSVDDIFDKNYSYRQFYTTPNTTIPNDQESFAKWLYYTEDEKCKEGNQYNCDKMLRR